MRRGTTPFLTFGVPFDPTTAKRLWITFSQGGREVFTVEEENCTFKGHVICVKLSQIQTLSLAANKTLEMQIRVLFPGETEDYALASDIITTSVSAILKEGVI